MEDINEEFRSSGGSEYFIGSFVVCENNGHYEVIDGQQRLTTLFACLCAFRKILAPKQDISAIKGMLYSSKIDVTGKQTSEYRLELQYEDASDVIKRIANDTLSKEESSQSSKRIVEAYHCAVGFLEKNFNEETTGPFLGYFLNKVKLIQIETPSISDALKIFETINARGVELSGMDLLKNLIFRQVSKEDFDKLKNEWKKITDLLESSNERPLRFLRYFIMANYNVKNKRGEEILREDEIYEWITKMDNVKQCNYKEKPFDFVRFMLANADAYVRFLNGQDKDGNANICLDNIKKLGGGSIRQHLMLLLAAKDLEDELFDHLAKQIEVLIFYYIMTREPTREFERKFSKWAKVIKQFKNKVDLNGFVQEQLKTEIDTKKADYNSSFLSITTDVLQDYRIRYILAKLTQYVDNCYIGSYDDRPLSEYITKGIEIEHILPDKPEQQLRDSFGEGYDEYKVKLGNLTLFEKPMNIVAGNNFFQEKKELYEQSKFRLTRSIAELVPVGKDSSINRINKHLKIFEKWDKDSITERQEILSDLSQAVWQIKLIE